VCVISQGKNPVHTIKGKKKKKGEGDPGREPPEERAEFSRHKRFKFKKTGPIFRGGGGEPGAKKRQLVGKNTPLEKMP